MKRAYAVLTACLLAISAIFLLFAESRADFEAIQVVVVKPGDTLWSIAVRCAPEEDPRRTIAAVQALNDLDTLRIMPGQELLVPCRSR